MSTRSDAQWFEPVGPDVVSEEFDGDVVILKLTSGQYFSVNEAGAAIWRSILDGEGFGTDESPDTIAFLDRLRDLALIVPQIVGRVIRPAPESAQSPEIETHEDLADLIMADPVHDVSETEGWPKRPEAR